MRHPAGAAALREAYLPRVNPLPLALAVLLAAGPPTYVAVGDSTGVGLGARDGGYPARLAARAARAGPPVRLENQCVSGARAADVVHDQLGRAVASRPSVVTVGIGINDALVGTDVASYERDLEEVARALQASRARVLLLAVPDLGLSPRAIGAEAQESVRGRVRALNVAVREIAARHGLAVVDLFSAGPAAYGAPGTLSGDLFHPSDAGYERWTDLVQPAFERMLREAAARGGAGLSRGAGVR